MNHLLFAFWFLQKLRKKKNGIKKKKIEDARWKANKTLTIATINIQMMAMDSSVFCSCVLFPSEIWSNWKSQQKSRRFWGQGLKKEHTFKVLLQITFCVETLKKYLENQNLKGKNTALVTKSWHKLTLYITTSPPAP